MLDNANSFKNLFLNRRIAVVTLLGIASGLPLALTGSTLQAWLTTEGVSIRKIGYLSILGLPYTLKFLWSPVMDRIVPPFMGRRRGWLLFTQLLLIPFIIFMSMVEPLKELRLLVWIALIVVLLSASQDIVVDAYRTDILDEKERGPGAGLFVTGYRIGMLVSGALALILSERIGWRNTYIFMACAMGIGVLATLLAKEPEDVSPPKSLHDAVILPFKDFLSRNGTFLMLLLIMLYKLGDAYAGSITTAFLIRGLGFSAGEVGAVNKGLGLAAMLAGAVIGGSLMVKLGLFRSLLLFGMLQAISNLSFVVLSHLGKNYGMFIFTIGFENLCGGMGTSAFVALLMSLCNKNFSATQYALLSSLAALGRVLVGPSAGVLVETSGWANFFVLTFFTALPGLILLWLMRNNPVFGHKTE